jgi:hypothetical protein
MARKQATQARGLGRLHEAASAVKRLFTRGRRTPPTTTEAHATAKSSSARETKSSNSAEPTRSSRRVEADIPMDVLSQAYTPSATSSKASFRSDGSDHQRDQEFASGVADDRWNDEDQFTNKSGDPRIGTHRRTYEPGEARAESRE